MINILIYLLIGFYGLYCLSHISQETFDNIMDIITRGKQK